jgi:oxygen-independent coproporphyrinogen-3 oxidase
VLGLYLHVPFCQAICSYCNFNRGLFDAALKGRYVEALDTEIRLAGDGRQADTIFFGGGTPSLLDPAEVARLVDACRHAYTVAPDAEITLETNPETSTPARIAGFLEAGVNRISFGAQSFDARQLQQLGRIHSVERIGEAVAEARAAGVENLSLDLMFWLPGQSRASWMDSVRRAGDLAPEHLSLYLLELYPNAPLREAMARQRDPSVPEAASWIQASDDDAADMYLEALEALDTLGFAQYEISNVARPGRESRHNLNYWTGGQWRGFGCGAHTTVEGRRWRNIASTAEYVERMARGESVALGLQALTVEARTQEYLFTGLRLTRGIDRQDFESVHGEDPWLRYATALAPAKDAGHLWVDRRAFGLTRSGMLVANEILSVFV